MWFSGPAATPADSQATPVVYLDKLNPEQRRAVEHGVRGKDCAPAAPLLVIAGAGSGKTNTLAHRVAHLIVNGADPRRILLMTFSRRAAAEMTRRVERICAQALGDKAGIDDRRAGLGRHVSRHRRAAAARICRADRARPGLHDPRPRGFRRPDEPGPPRAGLLEDREPFPDQGHLPRDLFALRQRRDCRSSEVLAGLVSLVRRLGGASCRRCSRPMSRPSRRRTCSITTICCSTGRRPSSDPALAAEIGGSFDHVLVDEYQDTNRLQSSILLALKPDGARPDRGRRRRAVDLFLPRRHRAQHPRFSRPVRAAGRHHHAGPQLPLDPADPRRRQRRHRPGHRALHQEPLDRTRRRRSARSWSPCATRPTRRATSSSASWRTAKPARC